MKKITIILAALDVILLGMSIAVFVGEDRTPPVIRMEETEMRYREGMSEEEIAVLSRGVVVRCSPDFGTVYEQNEDSYITLYYY